MYRTQIIMALIQEGKDMRQKSEKYDSEVKWQIK